MIRHSSFLLESLHSWWFLIAFAFLNHNRYIMISPRAQDVLYHEKNSRILYYYVCIHSFIHSFFFHGFGFRQINSLHCTCKNSFPFITWSNFIQTLLFIFSEKFGQKSLYCMTLWNFEFIIRLSTLCFVFLCLMYYVYAFILYICVYVMYYMRTICFVYISFQNWK